jgi:hypothetical protein
MTAPDTPSHNLLGKRYNGKLEEMTKAMIRKEELSPEFWPESLSHAAFIVNVFTGSWEKVYKMKPKIELEVFSSLVY